MSTLALTAPARVRVRARERDRPFMCGHKERFLSQMLADNAAVLHAWAGRVGMVGYKCGFCLDWHVGHSPKRRRGGGG